MKDDDDTREREDPEPSEAPPLSEPPPPDTDILPATGRGGVGLAVLTLLAGAMMLRRQRP